MRLSGAMDDIQRARKANGRGLVGAPQEGAVLHCDKRGHLSKDCPKPRKVKVRAVEAAPPELLSKDTKIEEVKE